MPTANTHIANPARMPQCQLTYGNYRCENDGLCLIDIDGEYGAFCERHAPAHAVVAWLPWNYDLACLLLEHQAGDTDAYEEIRDALA